ncbi:MAG: hypothetical protein HC895_11575 [Leptolyngbyaceae cyanobacterium SM1_3_5]|nr:hypothetical protein [Leptolyngbyaceae cyanobacterium SM1_3_5]
MTTNPPEGGDTIRQLAATLIALSETIEQQFENSREMYVNVISACNRAEFHASEAERIAKENQKLIRDLIEEMRRQ